MPLAAIARAGRRQRTAAACHAATLGGGNRASGGEWHVAMSEGSRTAAAAATGETTTALKKNVWLACRAHSLINVIGIQAVNGRCTEINVKKSEITGAHCLMVSLPW